MHSAEIRQKFLDFFKSKNHQVLRSAPLLPQDDPTLLFVNAGMVQFKEVFTGKETRSYKRATSSQKCVRAGGKHNDLEKVGRTARHHTFFEMLGNFSFGDYFKKEACAYAWEFLTQVLKMDPKKLSITVFEGDTDLPPDTETEEIWKKLGVPANRISRKGAEDNFWSMGDTGACGPCTEIHYDRDFGEDEGDQIMEIWNIVFMQYDRQSDGSLKPLPAPSVDAGMGLERLCTVLNNFKSNYDTDLLQGLVQACASRSGKNYQNSDSDNDVSMRVIADHSRATAFLIADGVLPSNEGRCYVLRRIMRRAIRHGARLGFDKPFFHDICAQVVSQYQSVYPELSEAQALIQKVVKQEELSFRRTLARGLELFKSASKSLTKGDQLDGTTVFKLYETYGFPADLTAVLAEEKGLSINWSDFEKAQKTHEKASAGGLGLTGIKDLYRELAEQFGPTKFADKPSMPVEVLAVFDHELLLKETPFYGESGGQIGDTGLLTADGVEIKITDTKKIVGLHVHQIKAIKGQVKVGDKLQAVVDWERRERIRQHHSVTHLLHAAMRQQLGSHIIQKGSLVAPDRLRFDFSHFEPLKPEQISQLESLVNQWIFENQPAKISYMSLDDAKKQGAMALFGEKYAEKVRVLDMGPHSRELCGGTHCERTGDIGSFRITSEGPLAAGIRRIEAVAGYAAVEYAQKERALLSNVAKSLKTTPGSLLERTQNLLQELKDSRKELDQLHHKASTQQAASLISEAQDIAGIKVLVKKLENLSPKMLQTYADKLRNQLGSGIVVLGLETGPDKCNILVALTKDLTKRFHAGKLVGELAKVVGGKGGGRPDFAMAGGTKPEKLDEALGQVKEHLKGATNTALGGAQRNPGNA